jgi:hypothetical protein
MQTRSLGEPSLGIAARTTILPSMDWVELGGMRVWLTQ